MADPTAPHPPRPPRARRPASQRGRHRPRPGQPDKRRRGGGFRDRLRRDRYLFLLCLGFLAFLTWALAITWWLMGGVLPLALTILSLVPAFYLFYLRDGSAA